MVPGQSQEPTPPRVSRSTESENYHILSIILKTLAELWSELFIDIVCDIFCDTQ